MKTALGRGEWRQIGIAKRWSVEAAVKEGDRALKTTTLLIGHLGRVAQLVM